jgi:Xaa-Pro dipeptidase
LSPRAKKLQKVLIRRGLSAMVVSSTADMLYFAGIPIQSFERFAALVVPADGEPSLILPALEAEKAREQSSIKDVKSYTDEAGPDKLIKATLSKLGLGVGTTGVESLLPFRFYQLLSKAVPRSSIVDATVAVMELRLTKDAEELSTMKKAGKIVEAGILAGIDAIKVGATELQIGFEIERRIRELGGEKVPFNAVLAGKNAALPHGDASSTKVRAGDCVLMDVSATYRGYFADLTRTVFVEKASPIQMEVYRTVLDAQSAAISAIRPGIVAGSLDKRARAVIAKAGYGEYFLHRTGHGLGLDVHEDPSITSSCPLVLRPGMTFTVEPGIYLPGRLGVRIEDDLAVTADGVETIGKCDKDLLIV